MQSQESKKARAKVNTPDLAKEKKNELTVTFFVGGKQVNELSATQIEKMKNRLEQTVNLYYSSHLDEYKKITKE